MKNKISILLLSLLMLFSLMQSSIAKTTKITIFHMNDIHSHINNLAKVAKIVNKERKKHKNVYFLNIGDNFSGNPIVDQYEPKGEPLLILFKLMKFDVLTLGNHEFDYGRKILRRFILKSSFKTISANIEDKEGWLANTKPFTVIKTNDGIKLALLGIIQVEPETNIPSTHPKNVKSLVFNDELKTIKKYFFLKKENNAVIILSHMGIETDVKAAESFKWVDLIIGGHSHTIIEHPKEFNGVLITQAGAMGKYLGKIELIFKNEKLIEKKGVLIDLSKVKDENKKIKSLINEFNNNETLKRVVGRIPYRLEGKRELGNMICDAIRAYQNVDISFMNRGGIRINRLNKKVTVKDIYTMHPFNNTIIVFNLYPKEIRNLIETSFNKRGNIDLFVSGISYTIYRDAVEKKKIKEIILKDRKGNLLNEKRKYSVGINNYIASAYKFQKDDTGRSTNINLAEIVIDYLNKYKNFPNYKTIYRTNIEVSIGEHSKAIGMTEITISGKGINKGSCTAGNLITDALRNLTNSDIALYPSRNISQSIKIKAYNKIYESIIPILYKFSEKNSTITGKLKGEDIEKFLLTRCRFKNKADLQVSGMKYLIRKNKNGKIISLKCYVNNKRIKKNKFYKVAFSDYEFNKYYKLSGKTNSLQKSKKTIAKILSTYITKNKKIKKYLKKNRIKITEMK